MKTQRDIEDKLNKLATAKEKRLMLLQWYKQDVITVGQIEENFYLIIEQDKANKQ